MTSRNDREKDQDDAKDKHHLSKKKPPVRTLGDLWREMKAASPIEKKISPNPIAKSMLKDAFKT